MYQYCTLSAHLRLFWLWLRVQQWEEVQKNAVCFQVGFHIHKRHLYGSSHFSDIISIIHNLVVFWLRQTPFKDLTSQKLSKLTLCYLNVR